MKKVTIVLISLIITILIVSGNAFSATPLIDNVFHITDNKNRPIPNGMVYTYEPGTTTPKVTYSDEAGTVPHPNPVPLDSEGKAMIYGDGDYTIDVKDMFGGQVNGWPKLVDSYTKNSDFIPANQSKLTKIDTIADLRIYTGYTGESVQVLGYYTPGDGGGGPVRVWKTGGSYTDNGGSVITLGGVPGPDAWVASEPMLNPVEWGAKLYSPDDMSFNTAPVDSLPAFIAACENNKGPLELPEGRFAFYGDGLDLTKYDCAGLIGKGYDYWETVFQNENNLKSDSKGTHIYLVGTGNKIHSINNLGIPSIGSIEDGGITYQLTDFTLSDSVDDTPATPRPFSCGIKYGKNQVVKGIRILPFHKGLTEYNNESSTTLSDEWDVCLWGASAYQSEIDVQAVGHARIAAHLLTENSGYGEYGNCEQMKIRTYAQGERGLVIRNAEQTAVLSHTASSFTIPHTPSMTITASDLIRALGTTTNTFFTVTSTSYAAGEVTINVAELVDGTPTTIRSGYGGTGWAKSVIRDSRLETLQHISGSKSTSFGLPTSIAREISGFPMRGITFDNSKSQTTIDDGNTYWGDCQDIRNIVGQYEGGMKVAVNLNDTRFTNPKGHTSNLRELDSLTSGSVDETLFYPRDCFDSLRQFPTTFTDGTFAIKPWRDVKLELQDSDGVDRLRYGSNGEDLDLTSGNNISLKSDLFGAILNIFGASGNAEFKAALTVTNDIISETNIRPSLDDVGSVGDASRGYNALYLHDQTTGVSRRIQLDNGVLVVQ